MAALTYQIIYPETRRVTREWIIGQAKDQRANDYMARHFDAEAAVVEENSRVRSLTDAMDILSDAGAVTFTSSARDSAYREVR